MVLTTSRLELTLQTPAEVLAWVETLPSEVRVEISPDWLARVRSARGPDPWSCLFQIRLRDGDEAGTQVGSCGYKGPPDDDGMVEIAYGIDEPFRGQGFATEAAAALVEFALGRAEVRTVRANTKGGNLASERTLVKCGFTLRGEFQDPEDGAVNRWEIGA